MAQTTSVQSSETARATPLLTVTAIAHAAYFAVTGVWPLLHIRSFQAITGPKRDLWLVKSTGALIGTIGSVIGLATMRRRLTPDIVLLAVGSTLGLAAIDITYVKRRVLLPIYLLDAVAEMTLATCWIVGWAFRDR